MREYHEQLKQQNSRKQLSEAERYEFPSTFDISDERVICRTQVLILESVCRQQILAGLKQNWTDLLYEYQGLSVVVDNLSKRQHKKELEDKLSQV